MILRIKKPAAAAVDMNMKMVRLVHTRLASKDIASITFSEEPSIPEVLAAKYYISILTISNSKSARILLFSTTDKKIFDGFGHIIKVNPTLKNKLGDLAQEVYQKAKSLKSPKETMFENGSFFFRFLRVSPYGKLLRQESTEMVSKKSLLIDTPHVGLVVNMVQNQNWRVNIPPNSIKVASLPYQPV